MDLQEYRLLDRFHTFCYHVLPQTVRNGNDGYEIRPDQIKYRTPDQRQKPHFARSDADSGKSAIKKRGLKRAISGAPRTASADPAHSGI